MSNSSVFGANTPSWARGAAAPRRVSVPIPRFDFQKARASLRKRNYSNRYYVDFHADANLGERILEITDMGADPQVSISPASWTNPDVAGEIRRSTVEMNSPRRCLPYVRNVIARIDNTGGIKDYSLFQVNIWQKLNAKKFTTAYIDLTTQDISEIITVSNHLYDIANGKESARYHYLPKSIWGENSTLQAYHAIDQFLASGMIRIIGSGAEEFMRTHVCTTNGQLIYAMIEERLIRKRKCTLNFRLMLLILSRLATCTDNDAIFLMNALYGWIVVDTCDSCLEKQIYFDTGYARDLYDMQSHPEDQFEAIVMKKVDAEFVTYPCTPRCKILVNSIPRLTHSGVSVKSHTDKSVISISDPETLVRSDCSMPTCYCIVSKMTNDLIVRACRAASLGTDGLVLNWFRQIYGRNEDIDVIDEMMVKLYLMYNLVPRMSNAIKNTFLILYFAVISDAFLGEVIAPTNFRDVSSAILCTEPVDKYGILRYCFDPKISIAEIQNFLRANNRHEILTQLITSDAI